MQILNSPVLVGHGSQCGLVIEDPSVSSNHAEVFRRDGQVYVRDLNSEHGTMINGQRFEGEAVLQPGDSVMFGVVAFVLNGTELVAGHGTDHMETTGSGTATSNAAEPNSASSSAAAANQSELISAALVKLVTRLLRGYIWLVAATMVSAILMFVYYERARSGNSGAFDSWQTSDTLYTTLVVVSVVLSIPIFALLILWSDQTHRATEWLQPRGRQWTREWAIGAWFIPFANIVLLPLILGEIRKIATATRSHGKVDASWQREGESLALILWVVFSAAGAVFLWFGDAALDDFFNTEQYRNGLMMVLMGLALLGAGATLARMFIRDVSTKLGVGSRTSS